MRRSPLLLTFFLGITLGSVVTVTAGGTKGSEMFKDVIRGSYYDEAIGEMVELGLLSSAQSGKFKPEAYVTRGQLAVALKKLRDELKGNVAQVSSSSSSIVSSSISSTSASSSSTVSSSSSSIASSVDVQQLQSSVSSSYNPAGSLRFDAYTYNVERNVATGQITISIVRIGGNQGTAAIDYSFEAGTAIAGQDFDAASGTVTFDPKQTSKKIALKIRNSGVAGTRTVLLKLKNPKNASLGLPNAAVVNILDPGGLGSLTSSSSMSASIPTDQPLKPTNFAFSALAYGVGEAKKTATITVVRSGILTGEHAVSYTASEGSAKSGKDFTATNGTLIFSAGETTKTFTVTVADTQEIEGNRTVSLVLSNATNGAGILSSISNLTIIDDEILALGSGSIKFAASSYATNEGKILTITVNRISGTSATTIAYATSNGSALAGSDYVTTTGTLTFASGETSKTFTIPILKDTTLETNETFTVTLSSPTQGVTLADPFAISVRVSD